MPIPRVIVVATLTFFLVHLVGGSPAGAILGANATHDQVRSLEHQLGVDRPGLAQFGNWISHAVRGDLGESFLDHRPVTARLIDALPPTLSLPLVATLLTLV